jgi:hypothetical protein
MNSTLQNRDVMDATCLSNDSVVGLKIIADAQVPIYLDLCSEQSPLATKPGNHCTPIIEVLPFLPGSTKRIAVMPFLLPVDQVPFNNVKETLGMIGRVFKVNFSAPHWKLLFLSVNGRVSASCIMRA